MAMNYKGFHRKYTEGTSQYAVYVYGDVVKRDGEFYVCGITQTSGYLPEETASGFDLLSYYVDPSPNNNIDGGQY
jgi:hypothetical protein